ncbi:MAG TPA: TonB C-terminal domain-containing protein [Candidatus Acidoferrum sp.]
MDERTLVPATLPIVQLDGRSTIPANLPLESIATRMVVPRDVNVELVQKAEESELPVQPTEMDERITVPQGSAPPELTTDIPLRVSEDLVEPDIIRTGEVTFLRPEGAGKRTIGERLTSIGSVALHIAFIVLLIFEPKLFGPHVRSNEEEELARRQITVLLPPGALESLRPTPQRAPAPHAPVNVDPKVLRKVAPPIERPAPAPVPAPQPEPPKRELPSAPTPKPTVAAPTPQPPAQGNKGDLPKTPQKLDTPDMPVPQQGLILPKQGSSPGDAIREAERNARISSPRPVGGGGQLPPGGGGGGGSGRGSATGGLEMLTPTQGVDFQDYLQRVYIRVKQNWFSVMPASVQLGDQGVVSLQFKIMRDGSVPPGDPAQVFSSGKEPLDRAAFSSIRASNPFQPLPSAFSGPYIELRFTYYYNIQPPNR